MDKAFSGKKENRIANNLIIVFVICLQLGASYYVSIALAALLYLLFNNIKLNLQITYQGTLWLVFVMECISILMFNSKYTYETVIIERELRIFLILVIFVLVLDKKTKFNGNFDYHSIVFICSIILAIFVTLQFLSNLFYVNYFFIPDNFFSISGDGAIASKGYLTSLEKGYDFVFRPTGFYSEPSYLGMILCSLFFLTEYIESSRKNNIARLLIVASVLMSQSLLGIVGLIAIYVYKRRNLVSTRVIIVTAMVSLFIFGSTKLERLNDLFNGKDDSSITRLVQPFSIMGYNFTHGDILGTPFSVNSEHFLHEGLYTTDDDPPFHNALFNIVINYGITSILIFILLFRNLIDADEILLFLIVAMQNGSFFDIGKLFLIAFCLLSKRFLSPQHT